MNDNPENSFNNLKSYITGSVLTAVKNRKVNEHNQRRFSTLKKLTPARASSLGLMTGPLILFLVWAFASYSELLPAEILSAPWTAVHTAWVMAHDGTLYPELIASANRAYTGLFFGVIFGVVFALLSGLTRLGEMLIDGIVLIKRAIPTLALIPLAILWLGIGEEMKIVLITFSVFIPVYVNTHASLKNIDYRYVELARTVNLSRFNFIRRVVLPGALPGFFVGLRFAVTNCWAVLVVLEQINTTNGVGYLMNRARDYGQTDIIVVGLTVYMILGITSDYLVRALQKHIMRYQRAIG